MTRARRSLNPGHWIAPAAFAWAVHLSSLALLVWSLPKPRFEGRETPAWVEMVVVRTSSQAAAPSESAAPASPLRIRAARAAPESGLGAPPSLPLSAPPPPADGPAVTVCDREVLLLLTPTERARCRQGFAPSPQDMAPRPGGPTTGPFSTMDPGVAAEFQALADAKQASKDRASAFESNRWGASGQAGVRCGLSFRDGFRSGAFGCKAETPADPLGGSKALPSFRKDW